jgi:hypothetical protein
MSTHSTPHRLPRLDLDLLVTMSTVVCHFPMVRELVKLVQSDNGFQLAHEIRLISASRLIDAIRLVDCGEEIQIRA